MQIGPRIDCLTHRLLLHALIAGLGLMLVEQVTAQTFTNLHSFTGSDSANPYCELIVSGNTLYGTTYGGGSGGAGCVFRINTDGTAFTNLHNFPATSGAMSTNSDGAMPYAGLLLSGNMLYGTAPYGGPDGNGTVFRLKTDGSGFTNLYAFPWNDHGEPYGGLILSGDTLYGASGEGGSFGWGSVFAINTKGTGFTNVHSFTFEANDGGMPYAGLTLSGNTLYGTTVYGGTTSYAYPGCVFKVNTDGTGYTNLYNFSNGNDGSNPQAVLVLLNNALYGTTQFGGISNKGVVFKINTDGTGFTNLHSLPGGWDEAYTFAGVVLAGNTLYGTSYMGGYGNVGTVFKLNIDGSGFTNLYHFTGGSDGANPRGAILVSGNALYGTTSAGGISGNGTVFRISLPSPPRLTVIRSGANVVLMWPTNATGFTLQSATNLVLSAAWSTVSPGPTVVNGQNAVTNPIAGARKFYRLSQ